MAAAWSLDYDATVPARARVGAEKGVGMALELLLATARSRVPIEEGTLERSGATAQDGLHGTVSFDTPYAVRQHEDMTMRHDAGRQAKYLESAMADDADTARAVIGEQIRRALGA